MRSETVALKFSALPAIALAMALSIPLSSCAAIQRTSVCANAPAESLICKYIPDPETADLVLTLVNYEMIKNDIYTEWDALAVLDQLEAEIAKGLNYSSFASLVMANVDYLNEFYGTELIIVSRYLDRFQASDELICEFDKKLLLLHIEHQREIVSIAGGRR